MSSKVRLAEIKRLREEGAEAARQGKHINSNPYRSPHDLVQWAQGYNNELMSNPPIHDTCERCRHFQSTATGGAWGKCHLVDSFPFWTDLTTLAEQAGLSLYPRKMDDDTCDYFKEP